jgi:hypothetical protein
MNPQEPVIPDPSGPYQDPVGPVSDPADPDQPTEYDASGHVELVEASRAMPCFDRLSMTGGSGFERGLLVGLEPAARDGGEARIAAV